MSADPRLIAKERAQQLIQSFGRHPDGAAAKAQCEHLARAIDSFHMEAIRFRMFTVDRMVTSGAIALDADGVRALDELKAALEAAGFHTKSHKAP
jgi:hypothetical protein